MNLPLHDIHLLEGGHMVDFHGYSLPVRFSTILEECLFVREKVGVFDISHMDTSFFGEGMPWERSTGC